MTTYNEAYSQAYEDLVLGHPALLAYWRMAEPSGPDLVDRRAVHPGTYANSGVTYGVTGPVAGGKAATFDGTSDGASVPHDAGLNVGDGPFTIEFWVKRSATQGANQTLITKGPNGFQVRFATANDFRLFKHGVAGAIVSGPVITDQNWHHIVITKNGATSLVYVDGADVTVAGAGNQTLSNTTDALRIGHESAGSQRFPGSMAELAIYSVVLTAAELYESRGSKVPTQKPARDLHPTSALRWRPEAYD